MEQKFTKNLKKMESDKALVIFLGKDVIKVLTESADDRVYYFM